MSEQSELQIFLSYANQDQDRVLQVYEYLVKNGFPNVWVDCKKLLPGQPWEFEIQRNLRKSDVVIFFLSNTSVNKRGFVQKELKTALKYLEEKLASDTYIIPLKLDSDIVVPEELAKIQFLDINQTNSLNLLLKSLLEQTKKLGFEVNSVTTDLDEIHVSKKSYREAWEGLPGYEVEFSIPVFHSTKFENIGEITKIIESHYLTLLQEYRLVKLDQSPEIFNWTSESFLRTNTYSSHYGTVYYKNYFLSVHYSAHWYEAGAMHGNYGFRSYNFVLNPLVQIESIKNLFIEADSVFKKISDYTRKILLDIPAETDENGKPIGEDKLLVKEFVESGTSEWDDFENFVFSEDGLEISFSAYCVGAYATGPQFVTIPYEIFKEDLVPYIRSALQV